MSASRINPSSLLRVAATAASVVMSLTAFSDSIPTAPIGNATASASAPIELTQALPYRSYRLFVESVQFSGGSAVKTEKPAVDEGITKAALTFSPSSGEAQALMIAPDWKAKEIYLRARKAMEYGNSYYFPIAALASEKHAAVIEGKISLSVRGQGLLAAGKVVESFPVSIGRSDVASLAPIELKGDAGSRIRIKLFSPCDFNIYETLDISAIRPAITDELSRAGARVFSENSAGALYSRPANALWIGADVPKECAELAVRVFSLDQGIPLKGVFTFTESDRGRYFFNPGSITLGHSKDLLGKPDLPKSRLTQLFSGAGRAGS